MNDLYFIVGFVVFWYALQRWILPALGIPTCLSGACRTDFSRARQEAEQEKSPKA